MTVSYNKLWKRLIDLNMSKTQLREKAGITTNAIAKMGKNENVSTEIICKICKVDKDLKNFHNFQPIIVLLCYF